ncbi:hypothetical protein AURDEDRAFT_146762 [Auricularia subglabra TFB-10046 SS5]|nr:hypothetical protein AURDEDRAFT_146762 [Auricularia subglabra TFB-10046 SS5]
MPRISDRVRDEQVERPGGTAPSSHRPSTKSVMHESSTSEAAARSKDVEAHLDAMVHLASHYTGPRNPHERTPALDAVAMRLLQIHASAVIYHIQKEPEIYPRFSSSACTLLYRLAVAHQLHLHEPRQLLVMRSPPPPRSIAFSDLPYETFSEDTGPVRNCRRAPVVAHPYNRPDPGSASGSNEAIKNVPAPIIDTVYGSSDDELVDLLCMVSIADIVPLSFDDVCAQLSSASIFSPPGALVGAAAPDLAARVRRLPLSNDRGGPVLSPQRHAKVASYPLNRSHRKYGSATTLKRNCVL